MYVLEQRSKELDAMVRKQEQDMVKMQEERHALRKQEERESEAVNRSFAIIYNILLQVKISCSYFSHSYLRRAVLEGSSMEKNKIK